MSKFIDYAIGHARLTIALLIFLLLAGFVAYETIPKEAEPDVKIPIIYVQLAQRGISPEDSERLLLRPVETQLKSVSNVKEMRSTAFEGGGYVLLEFEAGFDSKSALADVRAKVDDAKSDLPRDVDEPIVQEVNLSLYPVLVVALSGDVPERSMLRIARAAKNALEQVPGVLAAELRGARDEVVEIIAEPMLMKSYGVSLDQLTQVAQASNSLVAAGVQEGATGRFAVKVPSLIETPKDVLSIPVVSSQGATVTLGDISQVRPTFKDATTVTRVNGRPAMTIEISKRTGANLIETVDGVKKVVEQLKAQVVARETELKTTETDLATAKANVVSVTANIEVQKNQVPVDEAAIVTAKGVLDAVTAAHNTAIQTTTGNEQLVAAAQKELQRANDLVPRLQHYIALRDELNALDAVKKKRDEVQLTSLQVQAALQEKQQLMATAQKTMQDAQTAVTTSDQKMKDLTVAMTTMEQQKVAKQDVMTKTQTASPMVKAALEQVKGALALLPENADIKASADGLAATIDRQEKAMVAMTEEVAAMDKQMTASKADLDATAIANTDSKTAVQTADQMMKTLAAEAAPIEAQLAAANAELATAEQAVQAAATVVETRRQVLRPQLQLSQAN